MMWYPSRSPIGLDLPVTRIPPVVSTYHAWYTCFIYLSPTRHMGADKSLARPGKKQANVSVRMAWISFGALPCRKKKTLTARVSMLLNPRASLTCFRACFFPVRAEDLSSPRYSVSNWQRLWMKQHSPSVCSITCNLTPPTGLFLFACARLWENSKVTSPPAEAWMFVVFNKCY